ncbi:unnamed protein product, partial [Amoebophrya sp. A25]
GFFFCSLSFLYSIGNADLVLFYLLSVFGAEKQADWERGSALVVDHEKHRGNFTGWGAWALGFVLVMIAHVGIIYGGLHFLRFRGAGNKGRQDKALTRVWRMRWQNRLLRKKMGRLGCEQYDSVDEDLAQLQSSPVYAEYEEEAGRDGIPCSAAAACCADATLLNTSRIPFRLVRVCFLVWGFFIYPVSFLYLFGSGESVLPRLVSAFLLAEQEKQVDRERGLFLSVDEKHSSSFARWGAWVLGVMLMVIAHVGFCCGSYFLLTACFDAARAMGFPF